jgi:DNA topoisomerase-3
MKRFAESLVRQKGIKPPLGYKTSISICRKFLNQHAPKKTNGETAAPFDPKAVSPAQLLYAKKIAQGRGLTIPNQVMSNSATMSAWINSNRGKASRKGGRKTAYQSKGLVVFQSSEPPKSTRKRKADTDAASRSPASTESRQGLGQDPPR